MRSFQVLIGAFALAILLVAGSADADKKKEFPVVSAGQTCEAAIKSYVDEYDARKKKAEPPDLEANDFGQILNHGSYLNECDVPRDMTVDICVAVQNGKPVGVTVKTSPDNATVSQCVVAQVTGMEFPAAPRMDVARTHFAPEPVATESETTSGGVAPEAPAKPPPPVPPATGCGCGSAPSGGHASLWLVLALALALPVRRALSTSAR